jgi:hypothetical protein
MADWELKVMFTDGAVHGGNICVKPNRAIFDTGQVIRGLHAIYKQTGQKKYLEAAIKSSQWVLNNETNKEGRWIENNASSVNPYTTTYNIYAIVPIVELGIEIGNNDFKDVGLRAGDFTLKMQNSNGWFDGADFAGGKDSLLHTLAYTIDGLWDTGKLLNEEKFLSAARHALDGALSAMDEKGKIPGRLNERWEGMADWACLTGIAQIGITAMKLYEHCQDKKYLLAAIKIKEFLKACQNNNQDSIGGGKGAIWGSWPISGGYGQYEALNWAAKFFADLLMLVIKSEE